MTATTKAATQMLAPKVLLVPADRAAVTGTGVDMTDYEGSAVASVITGAQNTNGILKFKLEGSPDNSAWSVISEFGGLGTGITVDTVGTNQTFAWAIDLDGANRRFIRAVTTLTSGTSLNCAVSLTAVKKYGG